MQQSLNAQVGLLAFSAAVAAGVYVGNTPLTVLTRALVAMLGALFVAQIVTATTKRVLRDHLQRRKFAIDHEHVTASQSEPEEGSTQRSELNGG